MITQEAVLDIAREAIYTTIITSAPLYSQYISDSYVNSGADTYICAKNNCNFSCDDALWLMDARHYVRIYD